MGNRSKKIIIISSAFFEPSTSVVVREKPAPVNQVQGDLAASRVEDLTLRKGSSKENSFAEQPDGSAETENEINSDKKNFTFNSTMNSSSKPEFKRCSEQSGSTTYAESNRVSELETKNVASGEAETKEISDPEDWEEVLEAQEASIPTSQFDSEYNRMKASEREMIERISQPEQKRKQPTAASFIKVVPLRPLKKFEPSADEKADYFQAEEKAVEPPADEKAVDFQAEEKVVEIYREPRFRLSDETDFELYTINVGTKLLVLSEEELQVKEEEVCDNLFVSMEKKYILSNWKNISKENPPVTPFTEFCPVGLNCRKMLCPQRHIQDDTVPNMENSGARRRDVSVLTPVYPGLREFKNHFRQITDIEREHFIQVIRSTGKALTHNDYNKWELCRPTSRAKQSTDDRVWCLSNDCKKMHSYEKVRSNLIRANKEQSKKEREAAEEKKAAKTEAKAVKEAESAEKKWCPIETECSKYDAAANVVVPSKNKGCCNKACEFDHKFPGNRKKLLENANTKCDNNCYCISKHCSFYHEVSDQNERYKLFKSTIPCKLQKFNEENICVVFCPGECDYNHSGEKKLSSNGIYCPNEIAPDWWFSLEWTAREDPRDILASQSDDVLKEIPNYSVYAEVDGFNRDIEDANNQELRKYNDERLKISQSVKKIQLTVATQARKDELKAERLSIEDKLPENTQDPDYEPLARRLREIHAEIQLCSEEYDRKVKELEATVKPPLIQEKYTIDERLGEVKENMLPTYVFCNVSNCNYLHRFRESFSERQDAVDEHGFKVCRDFFLCPNKTCTFAHSEKRNSIIESRRLIKLRYFSCNGYNCKNVNCLLDCPSDKGKTTKVEEISTQAKPLKFKQHKSSMKKIDIDVYVPPSEIDSIKEDIEKNPVVKSQKKIPASLLKHDENKEKQKASAAEIRHKLLMKSVMTDYENYRAKIVATITSDKASRSHGFYLADGTVKYYDSTRKYKEEMNCALEQISKQYDAICSTPGCFMNRLINNNQDLYFVDPDFHNQFYQITELITDIYDLTSAWELPCREIPPPKKQKEIAIETGKEIKSTGHRTKKHVSKRSE
jgi:hypothetical protein